MRINQKHSSAQGILLSLHLTTRLCAPFSIPLSLQSPCTPYFTYTHTHTHPTTHTHTHTHTHSRSVPEPSITSNHEGGKGCSSSALSLATLFAWFKNTPKKTSNTPNPSQ